MFYMKYSWKYFKRFDKIFKKTKSFSILKLIMKYVIVHCLIKVTKGDEFVVVYKQLLSVQSIFNYQISFAINFFVGWYFVSDNIYLHLHVHMIFRYLFICYMPYNKDWVIKIIKKFIHTLFVHKKNTISEAYGTIHYMHRQRVLLFII